MLNMCGLNKTFSQAIATYSEDMGCGLEVENLKLTEAGTTSGIFHKKRISNYPLDFLACDNISMFLKSDICSLQLRAYIGGLYNNLSVKRDTKIN